MDAGSISSVKLLESTTDMSHMNPNNVLYIIIFYKLYFRACLGKIESNCTKKCTRYSREIRNVNGQAMIEFAMKNGKFISNSTFKNSARHITNRAQKSLIPNENKYQAIFNQIDYILIPKWTKLTLRESKTRAGTLLGSDHKLLTCDISWKEVYTNYSKKSLSLNKTSKLSVYQLVTNKTTRNNFQKVMENKLNNNQNKGINKNIFRIIHEIIIQTSKNSEKASNNPACLTHEIENLYKKS